MSGVGKAIVLIGFMGAGKSSVGRALARATGWPVYDTDAMIEMHFGSSIAEIFASRGETEFRLIESETLAAISDAAAIIVTGGGAVLRAENVRHMKRIGTIVYLTADEETLFERTSRRPIRPLLETENPRATMAALLLKREPLYRAAADLTVNTTVLRQGEVADTILQKMETIPRHAV